MSESNPASFFIFSKKFPHTFTKCNTIYMREYFLFIKFMKEDDYHDLVI